MSQKAEANHCYHCQYNLTYHLVLVTKYRHPAITDDVFETIKKYTTQILEGNKCKIEIMNHDFDHVHIMFSAPPQVRLSWKPVFWSRSYYIGTTGEATEEIVKKYIENQRN